MQPPEMGSVVAVPQVGGLHHRYERRAPEKPDSIALLLGLLKCARTVFLHAYIGKIPIVRLRRAGSWLSLQLCLLV